MSKLRQVIENCAKAPPSVETPAPKESWRVSVSSTSTSTSSTSSGALGSRTRPQGVCPSPNRIMLK